MTPTQIKRLANSRCRTAPDPAGTERRILGGYASQYDRRTCAELRARESAGCAISDVQREYCEMVEAAMAAD